MRTGAIAGLIAIIVLSSPALTQGFAAGITGCQTYAANAQDGTARCQTCYSGYILSADAKFCNQCPIGCVNCSPTGQCLSCGTGYYLSSTGVCNACGNGCSACDGNTCTQCLNGYYRTSNYCARCSNSCASCTSSGACTSCPSGYELKNGTCTVGSADAAGAPLAKPGRRVVSGGRLHRPLPSAPALSRNVDARNSNPTGPGRAIGECGDVLVGILQTVRYARVVIHSLPNGFVL